MDEKLRDFFKKEQVATLAVPIDREGSIHIATMRCMTLLDPLKIYFVTGSSSEKCALLRTGELIKTACEVGGYKGTEMYAQMRGTARLWRLDEQPEIVKMYFEKRGEPNLKNEGDDSVLLELTPDYLKYTDYAQGWDKHLVKL